MNVKRMIAGATLALGFCTAAPGGAAVHLERLSLDEVKQIADAAEVRALKGQGTGAIAIVDEGGNLLHFVRLDKTFAASAAVSMGKARTAALFQKPTRDFEALVNGGRFTMTALPDFTPLQGGVPIARDGVVVGAIGVSGAASAQEDEDIALAGADGFQRFTATRAFVLPPHPADTTVWGGLAPSPRAGEKNLVNKNKDGVAIQGYDPVAYFIDGKPVKGSMKYRAEHRGANYHFASAANRDKFVADPDTYAPQYGGYCGYAASINRLSPINPNYFQIENGRLILQHNQKALDKFNANTQGNIVLADQNWPGLVAKNGSTMKLLVNVDKKGIALQGFDPVAYFTENKPVQGNPAIEANFEGAIYHFASQENRETFENDPAKYAPQFGGFCGYAASINKISTIDPAIFQIIDERLVLQHTPKAYALFNENANSSLAKADLNWPGLVEKKGK